MPEAPLPNMPPMIEVELKFQVTAASRQAVDAAVARGASRRTRLQAIYFDTPDRRLAAAGLALRLRKEGRHWVQTAKAAGADAMQRLEHNVPLTGTLAVPAGMLPGADWRRHGGTLVGDRLAAALDKRKGETAAPPLVAQYRTDIWRRHRELRVAGGWVEVAFDVGHLIAGDKRLPVCELEIELLRGRAAAVIDVARRWVARHGLWLDVRSKALRGDRLARGAVRGEVVKASPVTIEDGATPDAARHVVMANCLQQILPNASEVASEVGADAGSEDHVHQLRVGLRRLRSALRFFDGWTTAVDPDWGEGLTRLFRQLGAARDRDALSAALLPALRKAGAPMFELPPAPPGPSPAELLRAPEASLTLLAVLAFQLDMPPAAPPPAMAKPRAQSRVGVEPSVGDVAVALPAQGAAAMFADGAARRLARWHRRILRAAKRYDSLSDLERHKLRKRVKRLRYASEFAASQFAANDVACYLALLAPLQDSLGRYNDLCVGLDIYRAAVGDDPRAWFAIGWLVARRDVLLGQSKDALVRFVASEPFWEAGRGGKKGCAKPRRGARKPRS